MVCGLGVLVSTVRVMLKEATDCVVGVVHVNELENILGCAGVVLDQVNQVCQANSFFLLFVVLQINHVFQQ